LLVVRKKYDIRKEGTANCVKTEVHPDFAGRASAIPCRSPGSSRCRDVEQRAVLDIESSEFPQMRMSANSKSSVAKPDCVHYKHPLFYMVVRKMAQPDLCQQCNQRQDCGKAYEQLGKIEGPSIVKRVVLAFVLPLAVFIGSLAVLDRIFSGVVSGGQLRSVLSFASALLLTFGCILLTKVISGKLGRDK